MPFVMTKFGFVHLFFTIGLNPNLTPAFPFVFNHDLPHPVPLNTAPTLDQTRVIGIAQAMQLPASTSPSASIARLMIAIVPH